MKIYEKPDVEFVNLRNDEEADPEIGTMSSPF